MRQRETYSIGDSPTRLLNRVANIVRDIPAWCASDATVHGCPAGWFCFYDDINFNAGTSGRRLQFQSCGLQNLTDFGFNDDASSWVNNTGSTVDVFKDTGGRGGRLWHEAANSSSAFVGGANNDQASSFRRNC